MSETDTNLQQPLLSIIVPAYNEEKRLPGTMDRLAQYAQLAEPSCEILIVDDGSKDRTIEVARAAISRYPALQVRLIENPHSGKAFTVRTGLLHARGQYCLHADADLSTPPEEFTKLVSALKAGNDVAIGSRAGRPGAPWYRLLMSSVWRLMVGVLVVSGFRDTQCGFKAYRSEVAQRVLQYTLLYSTPAKSLTTASMAAAADVEVLYIARKLGYKIAEVPLAWTYAEDSKIRPFGDSLIAFEDLLRIRWYAITRVYQMKKDG